MNPYEAFLNAIKEYNPVGVLLLFSGGHDSLCSTHYIATLLYSKGVQFKVYHGDTGTGIKETLDYVKTVCEIFGWPLAVREPKEGERFQDMVKKHGFPGRQQHPYMYRNLKEKPLKRFITNEVKSKPYARENVLLVTGIRSSESTIRMGYKESVTKDGSRVWTAPIMDWSKKECEGYMKAHKLPRNPVKDAICISGECLCGCFAKKEERAEISFLYPESWKRIEALNLYSEWPWGYGGKTNWNKNNPPGQIKIPFQPMCVGCNDRQSISQKPYQVQYSNGRAKDGRVYAYIRPSRKCSNRSRRVLAANLEKAAAEHFPEVHYYEVGRFVIGAKNEEFALKEYWRICEKSKIGVNQPIEKIP